MKVLKAIAGLQYLVVNNLFGSLTVPDSRSGICQVTLAKPFQTPAAPLFSVFDLPFLFFDV